jgi:hypothetical protein
MERPVNYEVKFSTNSKSRSGLEFSFAAPDFSPVGASMFLESEQ